MKVKSCLSPVNEKTEFSRKEYLYVRAEDLTTRLFHPHICRCKLNMNSCMAYHQY